MFRSTCSRDRGLRVFDDPAALETHGALAVAPHDFEFVRGDHDRRTPQCGACDQVHDFDCQLGVEISGGLVGEQDLGFVDEGPRDRDALLLAARERERVVVAPVLEAELLEDRKDAGAGLSRRRSRYLKCECDVFLDSAARQELEVLKDDADLAPQWRHRGFAESRDVAAEHDDLALAGPLGAEDQSEQARLARAAGASQEDEFALGEFDADIAQRKATREIRFGNVEHPDRALAARHVDRAAAAAQPKARPTHPFWRC
jgi:hypothetical protein